MAPKSKVTKKKIAAKKRVAAKQRRVREKPALQREPKKKAPPPPSNEPKWTPDTVCYLKTMRGGPHRVTKEDWCSGCKQWICDGCSINMNLPFGGHDAVEHLDDDENPTTMGTSSTTKTTTTTTKRREP